MAEDEPEEGGAEEKSFRERVEKIREERAEEGESGEDPRERMEDMMGGGGGGMGGNPFAQMMGGMMGGGPMGGGHGEGGDNVRLAREIEALRDEVSAATAQLERIADALEDE
ncbi:MAG: hypothetical protein ABEJ84_03170 [Halodesulfurarchaeum sp.]